MTSLLLVILVINSHPPPRICSLCAGAAFHQARYNEALLYNWWEVGTYCQPYRFSFICRYFDNTAPDSAAQETYMAKF